MNNFDITWLVQNLIQNSNVWAIEFISFDDISWSPIGPVDIWLEKCNGKRVAQIDAISHYFTVIWSVIFRTVNRICASIYPIKTFQNIIKTQTVGPGTIFVVCDIKYDFSIYSGHFGTFNTWNILIPISPKKQTWNNNLKKKPPVDFLLNE